jgi:phospholipid transport system substrate-binding protein
MKFTKQQPVPLNSEGLFYPLTNKSGSWKTYDIIIEGVSMVKNYRTQFRQIFAKDSPDKLIEMMKWRKRFF